MAISNDLLNPNLGVQRVLEPAVPEARLPQARQLAANVRMEGGLAELYRLENFQSRLMGSLQPLIVDDSFLRPEIFKKKLRDSLSRLRSSKNPAVRRFVRDDLGPLVDNEQLLREYVNMAVGG